MEPLVIKQIFEYGLPSGLIILVMGFLMGKVWPWFTNDYWPTRQRQIDSMTNVLVDIRSGLLGLQIQQQAYSTDRQNTIDILNRIERVLTTIEERQELFGHILNSHQSRLATLEGKTYDPIKTV